MIKKLETEVFETNEKGPETPEKLSPTEAFERLNQNPPMHLMGRVQSYVNLFNTLLHSAPDQRLRQIFVPTDYMYDSSLMAATDKFDSFMMTRDGGNTKELTLSWGSLLMNKASAFDLFRLILVDAKHPILTTIVGYYIAKERASDVLIPFVIESVGQEVKKPCLRIVDDKERGGLLKMLVGAAEYFNLPAPQERQSNTTQETPTPRQLGLGKVMTAKVLARYL